MPCSSSDGMGYDYKEDPEARREIRKLREKNDELTQMLCSLLRMLDSSESGPLPLSQDIRDWYNKHREWDKSQGRP